MTQVHPLGDHAARAPLVSEAPRLRQRRVALGLTVIGLCIAAAATLAPFAAPLVLAAWIASLVRPVQVWLTRRLGGGSRRAATVLTVGLVLAVLVPLVVLGASLVSSAVALVRGLLASESVKGALASVSGGTGEPRLPTLGELLRLGWEHGAGALQAVQAVAGATATAVIGAFVLLLGVHAFLLRGGELEGWLEHHAPLRPRDFRRLAEAFRETGRGLLVGTGLTALCQGAAATIAYFALGLQQAAVLGALTTVAALLPTGGTTLVWGPLSVGLWLNGRPAAALILFVLGLVISLADNFLRPFLTRYARLRLPTFALLVAMLGGIAAFGAWGLLLGPLFVRLAVEGLSILREKPTALQ
jgi:predicted PurR-regulated permease PerM